MADWHIGDIERAHLGKISLELTRLGLSTEGTRFIQMVRLANALFASSTDTYNLLPCKVPVAEAQTSASAPVEALAAASAPVEALAVVAGERERERERERGESERE